MSSLFISLKRAPRVHARKNSIPADSDAARPPSRSSTVSRRKTRPPPLQIIPELSENVLDIGVHFSSSPATARPTQSFSPQPKLNAARITLSAYAFSIDDALLMFGDDAPHSPALSASSSTSDGASSEDVLTTPRTSDDECRYEFALPTPRLCPQRISIRPLCIAKTRSLICHEDEDYLEQEEAVTEEQSESPIETKATTEAAEQDFYTLEFGDFISLSCVAPTPTCPARRDSLTLVAEASPTVIDVPEPKPRGRSRHSKPLPLLPPATPPLSTLPQVQITAEKSTVRRKRDISSLSGCSPPAASESRPFPRVATPLDIGDFPKVNFDIPSRGSIATEQIFDADEDASIYSRCSVQYTAFTSFHPIPREILETSVNGDVTLPRASIDSDAPRSSIDSTSSFASSASSHPPFSPCLEDAEPEYTERLRSRWSSSTLGSFTTEAPRSTTLLSPLRNVLGSRARQVLLPSQRVSPRTPPQQAPPALPKNKQSSPLSTLGKHLRRQGSRSSTSSGGTSSSDCDSHDGSPSGLKRKPIPVKMFLRAT